MEKVHVVINVYLITTATALGKRMFFFTFVIVMKNIFALFVLALAAFSHATSCLEAAFYSEANYLRFFPEKVYFDSIYHERIDFENHEYDDWYAEKFFFRNGALYAIEFVDMDEERNVHWPIGVYSDEINLTGEDNEFVFKKSVVGDTVVLDVEQYRNGVRFVVAQAKYGDNFYFDDYIESKNGKEEGDFYHGKMSLFFRNDTLHKIATALEDGDAEYYTQEITYYVANDGDPQKCEKWTAENYIGVLDDFVRTECSVEEYETGFVLNKVTEYTSRTESEKCYFSFVGGDSGTTLIRSHRVPVRQIQRQKLRDLKGRCRARRSLEPRF